jgi:hypothetical protein
MFISPLREKQIRQQDEDRSFDEGAAAVLQYIASGLPKEAFQKIDGKGRLKTKLQGCISRNFRTLYDRYASEANAAGGNEGRADTSIEKTGESKTNIFQAVYDDISLDNGLSEKYLINALGDPLGIGRSGTDELVSYTDSLLRKKTDTGVLPSFAIVKSAFKDNARKPETVTDLHHVINIFGSDLFTPAFRYRIIAGYLVHNIILKHIVNAVDGEIKSDDSADGSVAGGSVAGGSVAVGSVAVGGKIPDILDGFEIDPASIDLNIPLDVDKMCLNAFKSAVDLLMTKLSDANMDCEYIDYRMNDHEAVIREYEETEAAKLPDENFGIKFRCLTETGLLEDRRSYDSQFGCLKAKIKHLGDIIEVIYRDSKSIFRVNDFEDLAKKNEGRIKKLIKDGTGDTPCEYAEENGSRDKGKERKQMAVQLLRMRERVESMNGLYPVERRIMEERLSLLEGEFSRFDVLINPHQLRPGMVLDICVTSIKRKKTTLNSMAKVLMFFLDDLNPSLGNR